MAETPTDARDAAAPPPDELRYPIGRFTPPATIDADVRSSWIEAVAEAPAALRRAVEGLGDAQLDTPYRPGGWTVRQVVHHVPDSHLHSYVRFRWALTEEAPTIKAYDEKAWAALADSRTAAIAPSVALLEALHARWALLLERMEAADFERTYVHPQTGAVRTLGWTLGLYAWHGAHHAAHVTALRGRMGWG